MRAKETPQTSPQPVGFRRLECESLMYVTSHTSRLVINATKNIKNNVMKSGLNKNKNAIKQKKIQTKISKDSSEDTVQGQNGTHGKNKPILLYMIL